MAARQAPVRYMENPPKLSFLIDQERPPRDALRPAAVRRDQKIFAALSSVCQTPHPSGTPTNSQNRAALRSRPPLPMPNEPCWIAAALLALAAFGLAHVPLRIDRLDQEVADQPCNQHRAQDVHRAVVELVAGDAGRELELAQIVDHHGTDDAGGRPGRQQPAVDGAD